MRRIVIVGVTGSGKTTLAKMLSEKLRLDFSDLDELCWLPGWQERPLDEFRRLTNETTQKPAWIISGNGGRVRDVYWPRADTLVWIDYSFSQVFWQLLNRSIRRIINKQVVCNGNTESWQRFFNPKNSIIIWFLKNFYRKKKNFSDLFDNPEAYPGLSFIHLTDPCKTKEWLDSLPTAE